MLTCNCMRRSDRSEAGESIPGRLPPQREWRTAQPTPARPLAAALDEAQRVYRERFDALEDAHRRRGFHRALFLHMWARHAPRAPRPVVPRPLPRVRRGALGVTFVGHATVFLRYHNTRILTDPNLGRWLLGVHRAWDPGLHAQDLSPLDLVLVSHAHHDHLVRSS